MTESSLRVDPAWVHPSTITRYRREPRPRIALRERDLLQGTAA